MQEDRSTDKEILFLRNLWNLSLELEAQIGSQIQGRSVSSMSTQA